MFARHLSVMIGADLPLTRSLEILALQTKSKRLARALGDITERIKKGGAFSDALAQYPRIFSGLFVNMVRVGETGGNLEEILKLLAEQMKKDHSLRSRVKGAMIYPAVIICAMTGVAIAMMILVVPKLSAIFKEVQMTLPLSTRMILFISDFLSSHLIIGLIIISASILAGAAVFRTNLGKKSFDALLLKMPIFGSISRKVNSARLARTLGSLIEGGIPIIRGLQIVAKTLTNYYFQTSLMSAAEEIQKGEPLSKILRNFPHLYPPIVEQMVAVGEETGTLGEILKRLAEFYEEEVNELTKGLASVIEPLLMVVIGAAVGFFAVSMIQPMYSMMDAM